MSKGHPKTLGQRLGLLTGFGLITGGVLGWAYALFQTPGHDAAPPVAIPRPPERGTTAESARLDSGRPDSASLDFAVPDGHTSDDPEIDQVTIPVEPGQRAVTERELLDAAVEEDEEDEEPVTGDPEPVEKPAPPSNVRPTGKPPAPAKVVPARAAPVAVPDAVKAIRAAAAAARERLETPAKALPTAPSADDQTEVED